MNINIKEAVGIKEANCSTCAYLGSEPISDYSSYPICEKIDRYNNLKSFPFKKEMPCWYPDFWFSKFAAMIKKGTDREIKQLMRKFKTALQTEQNA